MRVLPRVVRETSCLVLLARGAPGVVGEHSLERAIQFARFEEKRTTGKSPFRLVAWVARRGSFEPCLAPRVVRVRLMLVGLRVVV